MGDPPQWTRSLSIHAFHVQQGWSPNLQPPSPPIPFGCRSSHDLPSPHTHTPLSFPPPPSQLTNIPASVVMASYFDYSSPFLAHTHTHKHHPFPILLPCAPPSVSIRHHNVLLASGCAAISSRPSPVFSFFTILIAPRPPFRFFSILPPTNILPLSPIFSSSSASLRRLQTPAPSVHRPTQSHTHTLTSNTDQEGPFFPCFPCTTATTSSTIISRKLHGAQSNIR